MASTYLRKTFSTTGDRQKFSLSMWVKRGSGLGVEQMLCECYSGSSAKDEIWLQSNDTLNFVKTDPNGLATTTAPVFRDVGAWYHFLIAADTTQGSNIDRIKIYANGVQQTLGQQDTIPVNSNFQFGNTGAELTFGMRNATDWYFNGSMANVEMVDGQQLTPAYFGSTDTATGIWKPGGSSAISDYGTNGFKLAMDTTSPGADTSGKGNTFTPSGTPTLLQGSPSNVWATMNPLIPDTTNYTYSNGNTTVSQSGASWVKTCSTLGMSKGKWYWEAKYVSGNYTVIGVGNTTTATAPSGMPANGIGYKRNGEVQRLGAITNLSTYAHGDIISCYLDMDNEALYYAKNGVMENSGVPTSGASKTGAFTMPVANSTYFATISPYDASGGATSMNFGEGFFGTTAAGTNADDNGQGLFAYDVPAGYYALNTKNLEAYG
jgi:hypothetical protein